MAKDRPKNMGCRKMIPSITPIELPYSARIETLSSVCDNEKSNGDKNAFGGCKCSQCNASRQR
jgi:hypothetical protein